MEGAAVVQATAAGLLGVEVVSRVVTTHTPEAGEALPGNRRVSIALAGGGR